MTQNEASQLLLLVSSALSFTEAKNRETRITEELQLRRVAKSLEPFHWAKLKVIINHLAD